MPFAHYNRRSPRLARRRGAALVVLIAAFAVIVGLAGVWSRRIVAEQRQLRRIADQTQTAWLAEAGVRRAAALLLADATFTGEEWSISPEELGQPAGAAVQIAVEPADDGDAVRITATARYPADAPRARATKTITFSRPTEPRP